MNPIESIPSKQPHFTMEQHELILNNHKAVGRHQEYNWIHRPWTPEAKLTSWNSTTRPPIECNFWVKKNLVLFLWRTTSKLDIISKGRESITCCATLYTITLLTILCRQFVGHFVGSSVVTLNSLYVYVLSRFGWVW